jgi:hypothetical protein
MTLLTAVFALLAGVGLLFGPGCAVGALAGLRGLSAAAMAPALTYAVLGVGAVVAGCFGAPWGWPAAAVSLVVACVAAWLLGRRNPLHAPRALPRWATHQWLVVGVSALGAIVVATAILPRGLWSGAGFARFWEGSHHLELVQYIASTGDGSSWVLRGQRGGTELALYPAALHDVAALLVGPLGVHGAMMGAGFAATIVAWVVGLVYLQRICFPGQPLMAVAGAALAVVFQATPGNMWGRFGYMASAAALAAVPSLIGWSIQLARLVSKRSAGRVTRLALAVAALIGIGLTHPIGVFSFVIVALPAAGTVLRHLAHGAWRRGWRRGVGLAAVALAVALAALALATLTLPHTLPAGENEPAGPLARSVALLGGLADWTAYFPWWPTVAVALLVPAGLVLLLRRHQRLWLVVSYALAFILYAAVVGPWTAADPFTSLWYRDPVRVAVLLTLAGVPVASATLAWARTQVEDWASGTPAELPSRRRRVLLVSAAVAAAACTLAQWGVELAGWSAR